MLLLPQLRVQNKEVLAIEKDPELVQKWSGVLTHVVSADATDINTLHQLGADEFGSAVVGVGTSVGGVCADYRKPRRHWCGAYLGEGYHPRTRQILERIGAHHVIYPEADAGRRTAHLVSGRLLDYIEFDDDFAIAKMRPPKENHGFTSPSRISAPVRRPWSALSPR